MARKLSISQVHEIIPYLDSKFVIFVGSAVSGKLNPKLPMVEDFTHTFLKQIATRLQNEALVERTAAAYALALVNGYYRNLLATTKFENFIFSIKRSFGQTLVNDLFSRVFSGLHNQNHSALAFLLEKRICSAVLTTNFDNALELCLPDVDVYIYPTKPPQLSLHKDRPTLVKLHGDALSRSCIATSPQLSKAKAYASHAYIETLLYDQTVLVFGYSGTGDIDIAPHLGKTERVILWGNYDLEGSNIELANKIDFLCDLSLSQAGIIKDDRSNILLELATYFGWNPHTANINGDRQKWEDDIADWIKQVPIKNLEIFITSFLSWRTSWPHVHISYLGTLKPGSVDKFESAQAAVQVAAYNTAEKLFQDEIMLHPPNLERYVAAIGLLGFTYWRQTKYRQALSTFQSLMNVYRLSISEWKASPQDEISEYISNAARNYLETVIEMIHNERNDSKRQAIVKRANVELALDLLGSIEYETSYYLNRIAVLEVNYWLGKPISAEQIQNFFDECMAMEDWAAAAVTTQFLLAISFRAGSEARKKLLPHLDQRNSKKLIFKLNVTYHHERFHRRFPIQLLNSWFFRFMSTILIESVLSIKKLLWTSDFLFDRIRVETSFLGFGKKVSRN